MFTKQSPTSQPPRARLATLAELRKNLLPSYLSPVPHPDTLRAWFDDANVTRLKTNPRARRGGGVVYYSVAGVERLMKSLLPGRLDQPVESEVAQ